MFRHTSVAGVLRARGGMPGDAASGGGGGGAVVLIQGSGEEWRFDVTGGDGSAENGRIYELQA